MVSLDEHWQRAQRRRSAATSLPRFSKPSSSAGCSRPSGSWRGSATLRSRSRSALRSICGDIVRDPARARSARASRDRAADPAVARCRDPAAAASATSGGGQRLRVGGGTQTGRKDWRGFLRLCRDGPRHVDGPRRRCGRQGDPCSHGARFVAVNVPGTRAPAARSCPDPRPALHSLSRGLAGHAVRDVHRRRVRSAERTHSSTATPDIRPGFSSDRHVRDTWIEEVRRLDSSQTSRSISSS